MPRRVMEGRVVGDKTNKTITVLVERRIMDPLYKKFIRRSKKYAAHDESNVFRIGDYVSIEECPPISKSKRWKVISAPPAGARDEKAVVLALAARAVAEQNKPEAKKKIAKAAPPPKAAYVKAADKAGATKTVEPAKKAKAEPKAEVVEKASAKVKAEPKAKAEKAAPKPAEKAKPAAAKKKKDDK